MKDNTNFFEYLKSVDKLNFYEAALDMSVDFSGDQATRLKACNDVDNLKMEFQNHEIFKDYRELLMKESEEREVEFKITKKEVIEMMGEAWWKDLEYHLTEGNEDWSSWDEFSSPKIVDYKKGYVQEADGKIIKEEWVNQTTNGGYTGDEFAGTVYFKLKGKKYLELNYQM